MSESLPPADRPEYPGDPNQPWNKEDFLDFLRRASPEEAGETEESPLDRLGYQLREQVTAAFDDYSATDEALEERIIELRDRLHGEALRRLRLIAELRADLSSDLVAVAEGFKANRLNGQQLAVRMKDIAAVARFLLKRLSTRDRDEQRP